LGWENGKDMIARGRSLAAQRRDGRFGTWTFGRRLPVVALSGKADKDDTMQTIQGE